MMSGIVISILSMACAVFWLARANSARAYDNDAYISDWKDNRSAFDMCMGFRGVSKERIEDVCEDTPCTMDIQTGWRTTFEFNGVVMLFTSLSFLMIAMGSMSMMCLVNGAMCARCWVWM